MPVVLAISLTYICFSHKFCIVLNLIYIPNTKLQKFMVIISNHAVDTFDMSIKKLSATILDDGEHRIRID